MYPPVKRLGRSNFRRELFYSEAMPAQAKNIENALHFPTFLFSFIRGAGSIYYWQDSCPTKEIFTFSGVLPYFSVSSKTFMLLAFMSIRPFPGFLQSCRLKLVAIIMAMLHARFLLYEYMYTCFCTENEQMRNQ